ncbi:MAG: hypothetical protein C0623_12150 [Desulfuromonas sp.]|nr:MAG: hypothetical protein C0623_12150 [Desulfuromonas sp.]
MTDSAVPEIEFPCDYTFKAFGPGNAGDAFRLAVKEAVNRSANCPDDAIRVRLSSGGKYSCVSALTHLTSKEQLYTIYRNLKSIDGLVYLL